MHATNPTSDQPADPYMRGHGNWVSGIGMINIEPNIYQALFTDIFIDRQ